LLSTLADDDLWFLFDCGHRLVLEKNQEILHQGQRNGSLFIVLEGALQLRRKAARRHVPLGRLLAGSFFGEISLLDPGPVTATVSAVVRSVVVEIRRDHLEHFIAARPAAGAKVLLALLEDMAKRFRQTDQQLADSLMWRGLSDA
jgi:CRP-like cAMP-binding protein